MVSSKLIIGLLTFILVVHILASIYHWYWVYPWFDMPMHFLGGFWLAMLFFYFKPSFEFQNPKFNKLPNCLITVIIVLGFVALVGVLWEFFEFLCDAFIAANGYMEASQLGVGDTIGDLFFDLLGGLTLILTLKIFGKSKTNSNIPACR